MALTKREKIIHYYTAACVGGIMQQACPDCVGEILAGVLDKRCKSLKQVEVDEVLADFRDEAVGGCDTMGEIIESLLSITDGGSRP